jgi:hypothetical protein
MNLVQVGAEVTGRRNCVSYVGSGKEFGSSTTMEREQWEEL